MNNKPNNVSRPVKTAGYSFAKQRARRDKRRVEAAIRLEAALRREEEQRAEKSVTRVPYAKSWFP